MHRGLPIPYVTLRCFFFQKTKKEEEVSGRIKKDIYIFKKIDDNKSLRFETPGLFRLMNV